MVEKRKVGRPKKPVDEQLISIVIDVDKETKKGLEDWMKKEDRSLSALCRIILRKEVELWKSNHQMN